MKYAACKIYILCQFVCMCVCIYVYSFCHVKWLIIEHVINMATTSKTLIKHKMVSFQGKQHVFMKVDATSNVP